MGRRTTCLNILNFLHFARFQQGFGDGKRIWLTKCLVAKCSSVYDHVLQFLMWFPENLKNDLVWDDLDKMIPLKKRCFQLSKTIWHQVLNRTELDRIVVADCNLQTSSAQAVTKCTLHKVGQFLPLLLLFASLSLYLFVAMTLAALIQSWFWLARVV